MAHCADLFIMTSQVALMFTGVCLIKIVQMAHRSDKCTKSNDLTIKSCFVHCHTMNSLK